MQNLSSIPYKTVLSHLLPWVTLFAVFSLISTSRWELHSGLEKSFFMTIAYGSIVYVNIYYFLPQFLYKKKYLHYFIGSFVLILLLFTYFFLIHKFLLKLEIPDFPLSQRFEERFVFKYKYFFIAFGDTMIGILIYITSSAFKSSQIALIREKEAIQLRSDNLNSELKFLRSQINPHFLFNALHNIHTLSLLKSDKTSEMIIMLSDMFRFMLYDCKKEKVMIKKEIAYLQSFITLAKLKDDGIENVKTNFNIQQENLFIEPMLFIPFLENSFKHSKIEDLDHGWIDLKMEANDNKVSFYLTNSIPDNDFTKDKVGGIGLENVKRRLMLLYRNNHELIMNKTENTFSVKLNLLV